MIILLFIYYIDLKKLQIKYKLCSHSVSYWWKLCQNCNRFLGVFDLIFSKTTFRVLKIIEERNKCENVLKTGRSNLLNCGHSDSRCSVRKQSLNGINLHKCYYNTPIQLPSKSQVDLSNFTSGLPVMLQP